MSYLASYYMLFTSIINKDNISDNEAYMHEIHKELRGNGELRKQKGKQWKAKKLFLTYSNIKNEPTFKQIK